ncbi:MAG: hypothetical protein A2139_14750 [Desulfobacca sp. RBG_16_60_12]|nr:MAG: hypothetical protein A2139_14750 [Desulfobacca sp. RBG_16_60_12]
MLLVEDAAEALGGTFYGKKLGTLGKVGIFSFYGNKTITTGEGGMVVTDSESVSESVRLLRGQGQSKSRRYWHIVVGYNYRMTELQAAIGRTQLTKLPGLLSTRQVAAALYRWKLGSAAQFQQVPVGGVHGNWGMAVLFRDSEQAQAVATLLAVHEIETRPVFPPIHTMPMYSDGRARHPAARDLHERGLVLPLHPSLKPQEIDAICNLVLKVVRHG